MKTSFRAFAEIAKTEEQPDGTLKVWGYASTGAVDSDGETITPDAMKSALPDYMAFGAVREMHDAKKAAGTAIEASVQDDGRTFFGAHVVDSEAVKKVQTGVYKGFSIGGKVLSRDDLNKSIIKGIKLVEVSLVDRPANPEAVFTMFKAESTPEDAVNELAEMLDAGTVTPEQLVAFAKAQKPAAEPVIEKGMGHVAQFALLLKAILSLVQDQQAEASREGDGSGLPAKLQDWLSAGGELLKEMSAEEAAELTDAAGEEQTDWNTPSTIYLAARAMSLVKGDLAKAGAALSAKNKAHVQAIHDASAALGACSGTAKGASADDLKKFDDEKKALFDVIAAVSKAAGIKEGEEIEPAIQALAKRATDAEADLAKSAARIKQLEALPAPGKALLKAIGKTADLEQPADLAPVDPVKKSDGSTDDVATLIKAIHAGR